MRKYCFEGIKVVDLAGYIAGAYCSTLLADMGAKVVKVESWEGDAFREMATGFQAWNRGKRGLALNLRVAEGREVLYRMVREADVVVENYRPGVSQRLGVDYDSLKAINPRIVHCSVTAYGSHGPFILSPGFDPLFQAMSGAMIYQGGEGNPPGFMRIAISDYSAAILAAWGIAMALFRRSRTGCGQHVETCLLNAAIAVQAGEFLFVDGVPWASSRVGTLGLDATHRLYQTQDGWVYLACDTHGGWECLCDALGREDLVYLWSLPEACDEGRITAALEGLLIQYDSDLLVRLLAGVGIKAVPVRSSQEVSRDPMMLEEGLTIDIASSEWGPLRQAAPPFRMSETPGIVYGPAPPLAQHSDEVLQELGYGEADIQVLRLKGVLP